MSHFSDIRIEIGLVAGNLERIILKKTVIGTDNSIPTTHHKDPQNANETIITSGDRFSLVHKYLGSTIFPITSCTQISPIIKAITFLISSKNGISENKTGKATAIIDQILGIKFKMKINKAQNAANSKPIITIKKYEAIAVTKDTQALITK